VKEVKIKICGIKTFSEARMALEAGADLLGFNFHPRSPRFIPPEACADVLTQLADRRSSFTAVGVFVNSGAQDVRRMLDLCGLDLAQLSGDEPPETLAALGGRAFKALRPGKPRPVAELLASVPARERPPAFLLDAHVAGEYGGTGQTADWELAARLAERAPLLLAGGLTPENVAEAVRQVRPWGVDVASGVESAPGEKDPERLRQFIQKARAAAGPRAGRVVTAAREDLPEILALQKLAYQGEAELNDDFDIPPLRQTLEEIEIEFRQRVFLKAVADGRIVGSVRAHLDEGVCYIARLIVHPDHQNRGIGSRLMAEVERRFVEARRFELFTSERSTRNLYLYHKLGYRDFRSEPLSDKVTLIFLEKGCRA
jgi:phosphoribosylanthranilate isomerase